MKSDGSSYKFKLSRSLMKNLNDNLNDNFNDNFNEIVFETKKIPDFHKQIIINQFFYLILGNNNNKSITIKKLRLDELQKQDEKFYMIYYFQKDPKKNEIPFDYITRKNLLNYEYKFNNELKYNRNLSSNYSNKEFKSFINRQVKIADNKSVFRPFSEFFHKFLFITEKESSIEMNEIYIYFRCKLPTFIENLSYIHEYFNNVIPSYNYIVISDIHLYLPKLLFPFVVRGDITKALWKKFNFPKENDPRKTFSFFGIQILQFNKLSNLPEIIFLGDYFFTPKSIPYSDKEYDLIDFKNRKTEVETENIYMKNLLNKLYINCKNITYLTGNHDKYFNEFGNNKFNLYKIIEIDNLHIILTHWFLNKEFKINDINSKSKIEFSDNEKTIKDSLFIKQYGNDRSTIKSLRNKLINDLEEIEKIDLKDSILILGHEGYYINDSKDIIYMDTPSSSLYYWKKWNQPYRSSRMDIQNNYIEPYYINIYDKNSHYYKNKFC